MFLLLAFLRQTLQMQIDKLDDLAAVRKAILLISFLGLLTAFFSSRTPCMISTEKEIGDAR